MEVNLVFEGVKFMVLGMSVVFSFLLFMVVVLKLQAKIITTYFPDPDGAHCDIQIPKETKSDNKDEVVAAISAAIMHHRNS